MTVICHTPPSICLDLTYLCEHFCCKLLLVSVSFIDPVVVVVFGGSEGKLQTKSESHWKTRCQLESWCCC